MDHPLPLLLSYPIQVKLFHSSVTFFLSMARYNLPNSGIQQLSNLHVLQKMLYKTLMDIMYIFLDVHDVPFIIHLDTIILWWQQSE